VLAAVEHVAGDSFDISVGRHVRGPYHTIYFWWWH